MFRHTDFLQFDAVPEKPDPVYAHKLQELIGGAYGEMTVTMQYLFQGWSCRMPGKYKDLIMDVATEEMGHVEMIATMAARLLEGARRPRPPRPRRRTRWSARCWAGWTRSRRSWPAAARCWPTPTATRGTAGTSWPAGTCWRTSGLTPRPRRRAGCRPARLYNMTDDPGVRNILKFNLARDTLHQNLWLKAIEELQADGLETTVAPNALFDEEYAEHATSVWRLSDGKAGAAGGWASGPQPDGRHEFGYLQNPEPLGSPCSAPAPDPKLYATHDGALGKPGATVPGNGASIAGKIKDKLS